jgi:hypothetical protein
MAIHRSHNSVRSRLPIRTRALLLASLLPAGVIHAAPISVLDAVMVVDPSLTVSAKWATTSTPACASLPPESAWVCYSAGQLGNLDIGEDARGYHYAIGSIVQVPDTVADTFGWPLLRFNSVDRIETIAYILSQRCRGGVQCSGPDTFTYSSFGAGSRISFDIVDGTITLGVYANYDNNDGTQAGVIKISGLPRLFDTFLTYLPGGQLSAFMPVHPDGFRSADSIQVWTGDVRSMPDWSQAQPLTCDAATNPAPGQVVTVADTLPDPALGHGRYYLITSVSGLDRRLGRQYVNGAFSARDPASLPVCAP